MTEATDATGATDKAIGVALDSIEAKTAKLQNTWQGFWQDFIDSDTVKDTVDFLNTIVSGLDAIVKGIDKIGGNGYANIAGVLAAVKQISNAVNSPGGFSSYKGGLINQIQNAVASLKNKNANVVSGRELSSGTFITDSEYNALYKYVGAGNVDISSDALSNVLQTQAKAAKEDADAIGQELAGAMQNANVNNQTFLGSLTKTTKSIDEVGQSASNFGGVADTLKGGLLQLGSTMLTAFATTMVVAGINAVIKAIDNYINRVEIAKEASDSISKSVADVQSTTQSNIDTLESLRSEFESLSAGVDENGNNISLTADEYSRYQEIVQQIVSYDDDLEAAYEAQNGHLSQQSDLLDEVIAKQQEKIKNDTRSTIAEDEDAYWSTGANEEASAADVFGKAAQGAIRSSYAGPTYVTGDTTGPSAIQQLMGEVFKANGKGYNQAFTLDNASNAQAFTDALEDADAALDDFEIDWTQGGVDTEAFWETNADIMTTYAEQIAEAMYQAKNSTLDGFNAEQESITALKSLSDDVNTYTAGLKNADEQQKTNIDNALVLLDGYYDLDDAQVALLQTLAESKQYASTDEFVGANQPLVDQIKNIDFGSIREQFDAKASTESTYQYIKDVNAQVDQIMDQLGLEKSDSVLRKRIAVQFAYESPDGETYTTVGEMKNALKDIISDDASKLDDLTYKDLEEYYNTAQNLKEGGYTGKITLSGLDRITEYQEAVNRINSLTRQSYDDVSASVSDYASNMQSLNRIYMDHEVITTDDYNALSNLVDVNADLDNVLKETEDGSGYIVENAEALEELINQADKVPPALQSIYDNESALISVYVNNVEELSKGVATRGVYNQALADENADIENLLGNYALLEEQVNGNAEAFSKYQQAKAADSEFTYDQDIVTMMNEIVTDAKNGEYGLQAFSAAAEGLLPDSVFNGLDTLDEKVQAVTEHLQTLRDKGIITVNEDGSVADISDSNVEAFEKEGVANGAFVEKDGHFTVSDDIKSVQDLADAFNMSTEEIDAFAQAIQKFNGVQILEGLDDSFDNEVVRTTQDLDDLTDQLYDLKQNGGSQEEIDAVTEAMAQDQAQLAQYAEDAYNDVTNYLNVSDQIAEKQQELANIDISTNPDDYNATLNDIETLNEQLGSVPTEVQVNFAIADIDSNISILQSYLKDHTVEIPADLQVNLEKDANGDFTDESVNNLISDLQTQEGDITASLGTDSDQLDSSFQTIIDDLNTITGILSGDHEMDIDVDDTQVTAAYGSVRTGWDNLAAYIAQHTIQGHINVSSNLPVGALLTQPQSGEGEANGGIAKGGKTLVGEEGRELVVDRDAGTYTTVGDTGAEFVDLPKDAIVFNHEQTEQLLSTGHTSRGKALASGNAFDGGSNSDEEVIVKEPSTAEHGSDWTDLKPIDVWSGKVVDAANTASKAVSDAAKSSSDAAESAEEDWEDTLEKALNALKKQLDLGEIDIDTFYSEANKLYDQYYDEYGSKSEDDLDKLKSQWTSLYDDLSGELDDKLSDGEITNADYLKQLQQLYKEFYGNREEFAQEYADAEKNLVQQTEEALENAFSSAKSYVSDLSSLLDSIKSSATDALSDQKDKIDRQYDDQIEALDKQSRVYDDQVYAIEQEIQAYNDQITAIQDLEKPYQKQIKAINEKVDAVNEEIDSINDLIKPLDKQVDAENDIIDGYNEQIDAVNELIKPLNKQVDAQNDIIDGINEQIDAVNDLIDPLNDQVDAENDIIDAINDKIDVLDDEIDDYNDLIEPLQDQIDAYNDQIDAINEAADARQRDIDLQKAQYELARAENQRTQYVYSSDKGFNYRASASDVRDAQENLDDQKREKQIADLQDEADALQDIIDGYNDEIDKLNDQVDAYNDEIDVHNKNIDAINKEIDAYNDQIDAFNDQIEVHQDQIDAINKEIDAYNDQIDALNDEIDKHQKNIDAINKQIDAYNDQIDVLNDQIDAYDRQADKLQKVIDGYEKQVDAINEVIESRQREEDSIQRESDKLSRQQELIQRAKDDADDSIDDQTQAIEDRFKPYEDLLEKAEKFYEIRDTLKSLSEDMAGFTQFGISPQDVILDPEKVSSQLQSALDQAWAILYQKNQPMLDSLSQMFDIDFSGISTSVDDLANSVANIGTSAVGAQQQMLQLGNTTIDGTEQSANQLIAISKLIQDSGADIDNLAGSAANMYYTFGPDVLAAYQTAYDQLNSTIQDSSSSIEDVQNATSILKNILTPEQLATYSQYVASLGGKLNESNSAVISLTGSTASLSSTAGDAASNLGAASSSVGDLSNSFLSLNGTVIDNTNSYEGILTAVSALIQQTGADVDNLTGSTANLYYSFGPDIIALYAQAYQQLSNDVGETASGVSNVTKESTLLQSVVTPEQLQNYANYVNGITDSVNGNKVAVDLVTDSTTGLGTSAGTTSGVLQTLMTMLGLTSDNASTLATNTADATGKLDTLNSSAGAFASSTAPTSAQTFADAMAQVGGTNIGTVTGQLTTLASNAAQMEAMNTQVLAMQNQLAALSTTDYSTPMIQQFSDFVTNYEALATQFKADMLELFGNGGDIEQNNGQTAGWFEGFVLQVEDMNNRTSAALLNQIDLWTNFQALMTGVIGADALDSDATASSGFTSDSVIGSLTNGAIAMSIAFQRWVDVMNNFVFGPEGYDWYTKTIVAMTQLMVDGIQKQCDLAKQQAADVADSITSSVDTLKSNISTDMDEMASAVENAESRMDTAVDGIGNVVTNAESIAGRAEAAAARIKQAVSDANSAAANATNISGYGNASASGGEITGDQKTLVGELGPELVVSPSKGTFRTVGAKGAEFTQLKRGDIVFNAAQTKQLLTTGSINSRGMALANGNIPDGFVRGDDTLLNKCMDAIKNFGMTIDKINPQLKSIEADFSKANVSSVLNKQINDSKTLRIDHLTVPLPNFNSDKAADLIADLNTLPSRIFQVVH